MVRAQRFAAGLVLLASVAVCHGEEAGSSLRGAVVAPAAGTGSSVEKNETSCTCDMAGVCGCARQDEEQVDKALLEHTQRLTAWWLAQSGSTHDTQLWSGPLPSPAADSIDLWVAVHGGGAAVHAGGVGVRRGGAVVAGGGATACKGGATACKGGAACGCVG